MTLLTALSSQSLTLTSTFKPSHRALATFKLYQKHKIGIEVIPEINNIFGRHFAFDVIDKCMIQLESELSQVLPDIESNVETPKHSPFKVTSASTPKSTR